MKSVDELVNKALEFKKRGLTEKEIGDELHLSPETVTWLLTRGVKGGEPPKDVKIGWKSLGVFGSRMGYVAAAMADIIAEESEKISTEPDTVLGIAINGIPYAALISEDLGKELAIYRPTGERHGGGGAFSSNYAGVEGKKVVLVDDVMSTGDTIRETIQEIQSAGGTPMLCVVLVNKTEKNEVLGVPVRGLIRARIIA
ncbi:MAG TPA: orotate phosphoribosyltransferase-like protein [Thermoplasmata archaeon]|nr:orotate phosphoribosyltransferase-like protein [Thermoplasmata archaeon]